MNDATEEAAGPLTVYAEQYWNDTGLDVLAGDVLTVAASGTWWDAQYRSGPEGYDAPVWLRIWNRLRRCPDAGWFELVGAVGRTGRDNVPIGLRPEVVMPASGRLYLYANDVRGFYWNNKGSIDVSLKLERQARMGLAAS